MHIYDHATEHLTATRKQEARNDIVSRWAHIHRQSSLALVNGTTNGKGGILSKQGPTPSRILMTNVRASLVLGDLGWQSMYDNAILNAQLGHSQNHAETRGGTPDQAVPTTI